MRRRYQVTAKVPWVIQWLAFFLEKCIIPLDAVAILIECVVGKGCRVRGNEVTNVIYSRVYRTYVHITSTHIKYIFKKKRMRAFLCVYNIYIFINFLIYL